jgi:glycerol-3-phosphate acyltransferase PlsY
MLPVLLLMPIAYLVGTFPSAGLIARSRGRDVTREGSGNPGASNAFRLLGWRAGLVVLVLDMGKGALAAGVGAVLDGHRGAYILGVAAVLGHVFPLTRRLRGGRGVATGAGVVVVVFPVVVAITAVVWLLIARGLHKASVASMVGALLFPVLVWWRGGGALDLAVVGGISAIVIVRHFKNLRNLLSGAEPDLRAATDASSEGATGTEG